MSDTDILSEVVEEEELLLHADHTVVTLLRLLEVGQVPGVRVRVRVRIGGWPSTYAC